MRIIFSVILGATLVHIPDAFASDTTTAEDCAAQSQAAMRSCLENQSRASERALLQAEKDAHVALSRWDEDLRYRTAADAALKTASTSFIRFRSAQCGFAASLGGGAIGNALALRRLSCEAELNRSRAATLLEATAELPQK